MKFALVFLIVALGIPAFMLLRAKAMIAGAREGQLIADATQNNREAKAILEKYARYGNLFNYVILAGVITMLCGYFKAMTSGHFPRICFIGILPIIIGDVGISWVMKARSRELNGINL